MKTYPFAWIILLGGVLLTLSPAAIYGGGFLHEFLSPTGLLFFALLVLPYIVFATSSKMLGRRWAIVTGSILLAVDAFIRARFYLTEQQETGRLLFIPIPLGIIVCVAALLRFMTWLWSKRKRMGA